ncbi:MAG: hypothetical protein HC795_05400 [Coleofasciculaceae cyanobacterium RL_1_1]|nr:hypothetical protein [Coleofasciculaceae cyanobacterium RL_1_1]
MDDDSDHGLSHFTCSSLRDPPTRISAIGTFAPIAPIRVDSYQSTRTDSQTNFGRFPSVKPGLIPGSVAHHQYVSRSGLVYASVSRL